MNLRHFYPDLDQLGPGLRAAIQTSDAVYLPWLNQSLATQYAQGDKWSGPWQVHPNIETHLINRGFIDSGGTMQSDIGYLDVEGPSVFWHQGRIGFTPDRAAIYNELRGRCGEILPPQMGLGFFTLTDTPAHWNGAYPADRIDVIHRPSSAVFVSAYFHSNHADEGERYDADTANAMRAVKWHSRARADMDVPLVAFVWAKWRDPAYQKRQYMPLERWRRWLRHLKHEAVVDQICYFGGKTDTDLPYFEAFAEVG